jgi:hypothetical protein
MRRKNLLLLILGAMWCVLCGLVLPGKVLVVLADPNCVQRSFDPNASPFPIEAARVVGALLPPVEVQIGTFNRIGTFCDEQDHPVSIVVTDPDSPLVVDVNNVDKTWTLTGDLTEEGVLYFVLETFDHPLDGESASAFVTLAIKVVPKPNSPPVLF